MENKPEGFQPTEQPSQLEPQKKVLGSARLGKLLSRRGTSGEAPHATLQALAVPTSETPVKEPSHEPRPLNEAETELKGVITQTVDALLQKAKKAGGFNYGEVANRTDPDHRAQLRAFLADTSDSRGEKRPTPSDSLSAAVTLDTLADASISDFLTKEGITYDATQPVKVYIVKNPLRNHSGKVLPERTVIDISQKDGDVDRSVLTFESNESDPPTTVVKTSDRVSEYKSKDRYLDPNTETLGKITSVLQQVDQQIPQAA